jgi:hypothetical protein
MGKRPHRREGRVIPCHVTIVTKRANPREDSHNCRGALLTGPQHFGFLGSMPLRFASSSAAADRPV